MNAFRLSCLVFAGLWTVVLAGAAEKSTVAPAGSSRIPAARFKQVRDRAAALFQLRNQPPTAPLPEENPLRSAADQPATRPRSGSEPARTPEAPPTELATLQQAVSTLRVNGTFEKDGDSYLVINSKPYRVGDMIQCIVRGETIYLRVREFDRYSVSLALNDTEVTLKDFGGGSKKKAAPVR